MFLYSGNLPAIHDVIWSKDGEDIDIMRNEDKYSGNYLADPSLTIFNVDNNDAGLYHLTVTNESGPTRSDVIVLGISDMVLSFQRKTSFLLLICFFSIINFFLAYFLEIASAFLSLLDIILDICKTIISELF